MPVVQQLEGCRGRQPASWPTEAVADMVTFLLGTHEPSWLRRVDVPLFVSTRRLERLRSLPRSVVPWGLDSGGFTELSMFGEFRTTPAEYVRWVRRYVDEIGSLMWAAPQDWMCEPFMLEQTGLDVHEHQMRTIESVLTLRHKAPDLPFVPVLQGWTHDDYMRHADHYDRVGITLADEPVVGLGSVCRRQATGEAERIVMSLHARGIKLHGFGMKAAALHRFGALLESSDSMAWSFAGRNRPDPTCPKRSCANCLHYALSWRDALLNPTRPSLFAS